MSRYRVRLAAAFVVTFVVLAWALNARHLGFWGDVAALVLTIAGFWVFRIPTRLR